MTSAPTESARRRPPGMRRRTAPCPLGRQALVDASRPRRASTRSQGASGARAFRRARSTPAFILRPKTRASSAIRDGRHGSVRSLGHPLAACDAGRPFRQVRDVRPPPARVLRGGGRPQPHPLVHGPGVEVVPAGVPRTGEVGDLVLGVAGGAEALPGPLVHPRLVLGVEAHPPLRQLDPERGVLLEGEAVGREVVGGEAQRLVDVGVPSGRALAGEREHEVQVDAPKSRRAHEVVGAVHLLEGVRPAERVQERGAEALDAERDAGHAGREEGAEALAGDRRRGQLYRPLEGAGTARNGPDDPGQGLQVARGEEPRGSSAPEHRLRAGGPNGRGAASAPTDLMKPATESAVGRTW